MTSRSPTRTRVLRASFVAAATLMAAIPGITAAASGQTTAPAREPKVIRYAISGDENNFTPYTTTNRSGKTQDLLNLIYDTLLYSPFEEEPRPWLAEKVEHSADNRTWTFILRDDVTWHDGKPFTADDVKFTWEFFFRTQQGRYSHHVNDRPAMESSAVLGPNEVSFTCRQACPTFDIDPGADLPMLPKHVWEAVTEPAKFTSDNPVGTGPFRLVEHIPDQSYRLEANAQYFKGKPLVDEIRLPIIKESSSMFLALQNGDVDAVSRVVPPESIRALEQSGVKIVRMADYGSVQINMNNQRPPFDNPRFRKALSLAVDTDKIAQTLIGSEGRPGVDSVLDPDSPFADKSLKHEFDAAKAQKTLDDLGMRDSNGDGRRENTDGRPLSFEILVSSIEAREVRASELVAADLDKVGVDVKVTALDPAAVNTRRSPKDAAGKPVPQTTQTGDYDMYVTQYNGGHFHFDPDGLLYILHCPGSTGFGAFIAGYCNKEFDALVDEAALLDADERKEPLATAQQILMDEPPMISLYFPDGTFGYRGDAFDEYIQKIGHGIFHKDSLLPGPRGEPAGDAVEPAGIGESDGGSGAAVGLLIGFAVVVLGGLAVVMNRRKSRQGGDALAGGPEVD